MYVPQHASPSIKWFLRHLPIKFCLCIEHQLHVQQHQPLLFQYQQHMHMSASQPDNPLEWDLRSMQRQLDARQRELLMHQQQPHLLLHQQHMRVLTAILGDPHWRIVRWLPGQRELQCSLVHLPFWQHLQPSVQPLPM
jgi:hypothetical protein